MPSTQRRHGLDGRDLLPAGGAILVAAFYAYGVIRQLALAGRHPPSYDVYAYALPVYAYARDAIARGHGLLWNELQNAGQPFFGLISTNLLYPPSGLFLLLSPERALLLQAALHLALAGVGAYALAREIGLSRPAAFAGALAFQLGGGCTWLSTFPPYVLGAYAWMPAALACGERVLRRGTPASAAGLGLVLSAQLLAGFPQIPVFTYQLLALRLAWELASGRPGRRTRGLLLVALACAIPLVVCAVQLLPALEVFRESLRHRPLTPAELDPGLSEQTPFEAFRQLLGLRLAGSGTTFSAVGLALAGFALAGAAARRIALFYLLAAGLYLLLALWPPLYELYQSLPTGRTFRSPKRFLWVTSLAMSPVVACGVEAALGRSRVGRRAALVALGLAALAVLAFALVSPVGLLRPEWILAGAALGLLAWSALSERGGKPARAGVVALLALNLLWTAPNLFMGYLPDAAALYEQRGLYAALAQRMTPQDRIYAFGRPGGFSNMPKSASLFGVRSVLDYEPQTARRYAELIVRLETGRPLRSVNEFLFRGRHFARSRPLLDLLGARYLVVDAEAEGAVGAPLLEGLAVVLEDARTRVYENPQALPRAFYVPELRVLAEPAAVVERLASPRFDPRRAALVEQPPSDGFLGRGPGGEGEARIERSRGEEVVVGVEASREGFLVLMDQHYPGWQAEVDGAPAPILRVNHAFRAVRVPRGTSTVAFRYRPRSVRVGTVVSLLGLLGLAAWGAAALARGFRRGSATGR